MRRYLVRRHPVAFWSVVALVAVVAAVMTRPPGPRYGPERRVPVAVRPVDAGSTIGPGDIAWRPWPRALLPAAPLARDALGRATRVALVPGQPLLAAWLSPSLLPPGSRAMAVPVGTGTPPLQAGDTVDVLAASDADPDAVLVASAVLVLAVRPDSVTVAVPAADAPRLAAALARGTVTLALLAPTASE